MNKHLKVLIIENEPLIIDSIKLAFTNLSGASNTLSFSLTVINKNDFTLSEISNLPKFKALDLVLLNINMYEPSIKSLSFKEDLAIALKNQFPNIRLILLASHCDNYRINNAFKTLKPEGFLIKSDIDFKKLVKAIGNVIGETSYYSKKILNQLRRYIINDLYLDETDRLILYHLSMGIRTKDLTNLVPMTIGGIEKRKRRLKDIFKLKSHSTDKCLLLSAREKGFI